MHASLPSHQRLTGNLRVFFFPKSIPWCNVVVFQITAKGDVKFQILTSYLQLCKTIKNATEIMLITCSKMCNRYGSQGSNRMDFEHPNINIVNACCIDIITLCFMVNCLQFLMSFQSFLNACRNLISHTGCSMFTCKTAPLSAATTTALFSLFLETGPFTCFFITQLLLLFLVPCFYSTAF